MSQQDVLEELHAETEVMRGLLLWALYHHQGGKSEVGQPIRKFLGIGQHDSLTPEQIIDATTTVDAVMHDDLVLGSSTTSGNGA